MERHRGIGRRRPIDRIALVRVRTDFLVIGSGVAGLRAALSLAEVGDVIVLTKADPGESNTGYAQGGIAAAVGADDSPELHARDTIEAGDGLCRREAVRRARARRPALRARAARLGRRVRSRRRRGARRWDARPRTACAACCTRATPPAARLAACCGRARRKSPRVRVLDDGAWCCRCDVEDGVCAGATFVDRAGEVHDVARRADAARHRRRRSGVSRDDESGGGDRRRHGDGVRGRRARRRPRVRAVPSDGAERRRRAAVPAVRGAARRRRPARSTTRASASSQRYDPAGDLASRDVVARAIVREQIAHRRAGLPLDGAPRSRLRARALPDDRAGVPRRRARPGERSDSGQPGRALRDGRRGNRPRRPHVGGRTCSRPARWPAPACTAPTGWPATRCSKGWCSAPGPRRRCRSGTRAGRRSPPTRCRSMAVDDVGAVVRHAPTRCAS